MNIFKTEKYDHNLYKFVADEREADAIAGPS